MLSIGTRITLLAIRARFRVRLSHWARFADVKSDPLETPPTHRIDQDGQMACACTFAVAF